MRQTLRTAACAAASLAATLVLACGRSTAPSGAISVTETASLPQVAHVALVETGDLTAMFDRDSVTLAGRGKVTSRIAAPSLDGKPLAWAAAAALPSPDGAARWIVGVAGGRLWRIVGTGTIEAASERLGLGADRVLALDSVGPMTIIGLAGGIAIATGGHVMRFPGDDAAHVAAASTRVAFTTGRGVSVFDLASSTRVDYAMAGVEFVGFTSPLSAHPQLVVGVGGPTVYEERAGTLHKAEIPPARKLVASGGLLWILSDHAVFVRDEGAAQLLEPHGVAANVSTMFGARPSGVWLGTDHLVRVTTETSADTAGWRATVLPIFERSCARCHLPGGSADVDLSTVDRWTAARAEILARVVVDRTMPPASDAATLSDPDREALGAWLEPGVSSTAPAR